MRYVTRQKLLGFGSFKFEKVGVREVKEFLAAPELVSTIHLVEMQELVKRTAGMDVALTAAERPTEHGDEVLVFNTDAQPGFERPFGILRHLPDAPRTMIAEAAYAESMPLLERELEWLQRFVENARRGVFWDEEVKLVINGLEAVHHELEKR